MCSDIAIKVDNLSKYYPIYDSPRDRVRQMLTFGDKKYYREFRALNDISFEVKRGETVGVVGRNGSGKSTLLQMICGTLNPTRGTVTVNGRIGALLELGAGFNPEFTGRENVYLNAMLYGLSRRDVDKRFDAIAAFADIGPFIDQPVKTYSSGMVVRLAFAVQAQIDPDILVVDEALAVGDAKFQAKCFERLRQLKERGTSILLVTHSTEQIVTHCTRAILLDGGELRQIGEPRSIANQYMDLLFSKESTDHAPPPGTAGALPPVDLGLNFNEDVFATRAGYNPHEHRWGDRAAAITDFHMHNGDNVHRAVHASGSKITLNLAFRFHRSLGHLVLGVTVKTKEGVTVYGTNTRLQPVATLATMGQESPAGMATVTFDCHLAEGDYFISLGLVSADGADLTPHDRRYDAIHLSVQPTPAFFGLADLHMTLQARGIKP